MSERDDAWAAVHNPSTDAAALARIAQAYPEFGDAIARHPNCYDGLRDWLAALPAPGAQSPEPLADGPETVPVAPEQSAQDASPARRSRRRLVIVAAVVGGIQNENHRCGVFGLSCRRRHQGQPGGQQCGQSGSNCPTAGSVLCAVRHRWSPRAPGAVLSIPMLGQAVFSPAAPDRAMR